MPHDSAKERLGAIDGAGRSARRPEAKKVTAKRGASTGRESASDQVVNRILELVRSRSLCPGDRLPPERKLIEIFSIGRPGLREALRALATLGVIEIHHGGGAFVTDLNARRLLAPLDLVVSLTPSILADSTDCRRLIECEAVRRATTNATSADIEELHEMIQAHDKVARDPVGFRILDSRFHSKLYALAKNGVLERIAESLYSIGLEERRAVTEQPGLIDKSTQDHRRIFAALRNGDPDGAVAAMEVHLRHIAETSEALLARRP